MKTAAFIILLITGCVMQSGAAGVGVFGSYWDSREMGSEPGAGVVLRLDGGQNLFVDLRGAFFSFERDGLASGAVNTTTLEVIPFELVLMSRSAPAPDFAPYIGGGVGYYIADGDFEVAAGKTDLDIGNELAYFLVGGLDIQLTRSFNFFAEAKYLWLEFDDVKPQGALGPEPAEFDIKMTGLTFTIGVLLRW